MKKRIVVACVSGVIWGAAACSSSSNGPPSPEDSGVDAMSEPGDGAAGNPDATMTGAAEAGPDAGMDSTTSETDGGSEAGDAGTALEAGSYDASNTQFDGSAPANCGAWTGFTATTRVAYVGETITLGASASGADVNNLGYTWSQAGNGGTAIGVFGQTADEAAGASDAMSFLCTTAGTATISVVVDDGAQDAGACPDSLTTASTTITCLAATNDLVEAAWVELGSTGSSVTDGGSPAGTNTVIARAITAASTCPTITLNGGSAQPMNLRVGAGTIPLRPTSSTALGPQYSKPSIFPVQTCELVLPSGTTSATVNAAYPGGAQGIALPLPKANAQTIVVIADTGCRLQYGTGGTSQWQDCNNPSVASDTNAYTFGATAAAAAGLHPDLVIHIGDYDYRDNECPPDMAGCAGSPWGYGWDTWQADFFKPAQPLLTAAPWIVGRGNHEQCTRSGQGWFRFLDTNGYDSIPNDDCNAQGAAIAADAGGGFAGDNVGSYNTPYAVQVRDDTRVIVFDSNNIAKTAIAPTGANGNMYSAYQTELQQTGELIQADAFNIWTNHHPILGLAAGTPVTSPAPALLSVMQNVYPDTLFPPGINMALHGHTHLFEAIDFAPTSTDGGVPNNYPSTFLSGNAGTQLDTDLPTPLPNGTTPAAGALIPPDIDAIAHSPNFGFLVMQYQPGDAADGATWLLTEYKQDGVTVRTSCTAHMNGRNTCTVLGDIQ
jgi:hypothetical protein